MQELCKKFARKMQKKDRFICVYRIFVVILHAKLKTNAFSAVRMINTIEYIVLLVACFAMQTGLSEAEAYRYLNTYGAIALCEKHYDIMHTLAVEDNISTLRAYCQRKGGKI